MSIGKLISDKAEYKYSEEDLKRLIANDLEVDVNRVTLNFIRQEEGIPGDRHNFGSSFYYKIDVTVDNTKVVKPTSHAVKIINQL